jgi:Skp family chaperone for outer membrane proteins
MKFHLTLALVAILALPLLSSCAEQNGGGIRVVNHDTVLRESELGKEQMSHLQGMSEEFTSELRAMQQENATEEEQAAQQQIMQQKVGEYRTMLQAEQEQVIQKLQNAFNKAVDQYRAANDVDLVLNVQSVISYSEEMDATQQIIEIMNGMDVEMPGAEGEDQTGASQ